MLLNRWPIVKLSRHDKPTQLARDGFLVSPIIQLQNQGNQSENKQPEHDHKAQSFIDRHRAPPFKEFCDLYSSKTIATTSFLRKSHRRVALSFPVYQLLLAHAIYTICYILKRDTHMKHTNPLIHFSKT